MVARPRPKRGSGFAESMVDRPPERLLRPAGVDLGELGEAQHRLHPRQLRRQLARPLRRPPRPVAPALHQPQLGEPRPGQRVLRLVLDRLLHRLRAPPRSGSAPARHRRGRSSPPPSGGSARPPVGHLPAPARGRSAPRRSPRSARRRGRRRDRAPPPGRCRPAPPRRGRPTATSPRDRGNSPTPRSVSGIASKCANAAGSWPRAASCNRAAQRLRQLLRRSTRGIGQRRQDRRIEQRPLHGVARPDDEVGGGRPPGLGRGGFAAGDRQFAVRVAGADAALEDDDQRPLRLDLDQELGALHRRVDEWRFDREYARMRLKK